MKQLDLFAAQAAEKKIANAIAEKKEATQDDAVSLLKAKEEPLAEKRQPVKKENIQPGNEEPVVKAKRGRKSFKELDELYEEPDIPADELLFSKQYYNISVVADWFHVNTSLIRFWENEFDILQPRKTRKGDRLFRPEDVKNLQIISHLLRRRKFSIEGARQYLKDNEEKARANMHLIQSLTKIRAFLLELKANLGA